MVGSVFSPYYAAARRRGHAEPEDYCALNVCLYGRHHRAWTMTERGRGQLGRSASELVIGPSSVEWDGNALTVRIDERGTPLPSRVRGTVRLYPKAITGHQITLDSTGRHRWWPIAPEARVEVELTHPHVRWSGHGYLDHNAGDEPLEAGFREWDWSRSNLRRGAAVLYDMTYHDGSRRSLALRFDGSGGAEEFEPPPRAPLPQTRWWRIRRGIQTEPGSGAEVVETLEDTPFYARSTVNAHLLGEPVTAMHESLSLTRFASRWVQVLLPFRMPRITR